jgi:hypothetical protein
MTTRGGGTKECKGYNESVGLCEGIRIVGDFWSPQLDAGACDSCLYFTGGETNSLRVTMSMVVREHWWEGWDDRKWRRQSLLIGYIQSYITFNLDREIDSFPDNNFINSKIN